MVIADAVVSIGQAVAIAPPDAGEVVFGARVLALSYWSSSSTPRRLVDIITDGIVPIGDEKEAEERFEEILRTIPKYGQNDKTLERYLGYHEEIQRLSAQ